MAEGVIGMVKTCVTSSVIEMHATGLKMLINNAPMKEGIMQKELKPFPMT
jgi:hypothetical protein